MANRYYDLGFLRLITFLCCLACIGGCKNAATEVLGPVYSGEELYRGIFFGQGPTAAKIPLLTSSAMSLSEAAREGNRLTELLVLEDHIIAKIAERHPTFFDAFRRGIQSGDHLKIKRALAVSTGATIQAIKALPEYTVHAQEVNRFQKSMQQLQVKDFLDASGKLDQQALTSYISKKMQLAGGRTNGADCAALLVVFVSVFAVFWYVIVAGGVAVAAAVAFAVAAGWWRELAYDADLSTPSPPDIGYDYGYDQAFDNGGGYASDMGYDYGGGDVYDGGGGGEYGEGGAGEFDYAEGPVLVTTIQTKKANLKTELIVNQIAVNLRAN